MLRKGPAGKPRKKDVHFVFKAHAPGEVYETRIPDAKTYIVEEVRGEIRPRTEKGISKSAPAEVFGRTRREFLLGLVRSGKIVKVGETFKLREMPKYRLLAWKVRKAEEKLGAEPSLNYVKNFFVSEANFIRERHRLIRKTIKESLKNGGVDAQYGTFHSLLSRELKREGINSSRDIAPVVFDLDGFVLRKLLAGAIPTDLEYKKGYISRLCATLNILEAILGKHDSMVTDADNRVFMLVQTTMLNRCSEEQINNLLNLRLPREIHEELCRINGLPPNPTRAELEAFLNKYSEHWRRLQRAEERNRTK